MKRALCVAAAVIGLGVVWPAEARQTAPAPDPTVLDEVLVQGGLEARAQQFTRELSGPPAGRGLARWRGPVCIGVYNFRRQAGEQIADGLARSGGALNVPIADGDCEPNILIIGAVDSRRIAAEWVDRAPREFRPNISGARASRSELEYFTSADVPIRWWALSRPAYFDIFKGRRVLAGGPNREPIEVRTAMNRNRHTRDDLQRVIVIIDVERVAGVGLDRLIDYLTMVSFTQVDMQADLGGFPTILNLFRPGGTQNGLTDWDQAYVRGLYDVPRDLRIEEDLQVESMAGRLRGDAVP